MPDYPPGAALPAPTATSLAALPRQGGEVLSLGAMLAILRRHRMAWLATTLLVPLLGIVALHRLTPIYTASGMLIYEPNEYKAQALQSVLREGPTTEATMASQAELLQSLHIAQKVAERGRLDANPEFNPSVRPPSWTRRLFGFLSPPPEPDTHGPQLDTGRNAMLLSVQAALHAKPVRFSRVLEVTFTAQDPVVAAAAVNNAMDVYIKDQYAAKARAVHRATEQLQHRAEALRRETQRHEDAIAAYRAKSGLFQGMHAGFDAEQVSHLTEEMVRARTELANADARLDAARGRAGAGAQAAIAPSVVQLRAQQDQLAAQAQIRQGRLGASHPEAEGLRRQTEAAQRNLAAEIARVVASIDAERRVAKDRMATLEANLRTAQQEADRTSRVQIPLNAMQRDADAARAQLQAVLMQIQETAQKATIETSEAHEISQALPPQRPSWPPTGPMMAGACAAGVFAGLLLVYVLHLTDTSINGSEDVRSATGLPCFALLPEVGKRALGHEQIEDYVVKRPLTAFAEQIRGLRAGLWLGAHRPRTIAVTAARPGEGKTLLTLSLGRSARLAGEKVLLIECDLRRPKFARIFGAENDPGLSDLLRGNAALADVVRDDPLSGLAYIPAGKPGGDMLSLFLSDAMTRLLHAAREEYDLVLLDTPPIQAMSEARVAAALADAVLLCVRWRHTPRSVLRHALELLRETHANTVGAVLTRVDARAHVRSGGADAEVYHRRYRSYYKG
jgi:succinoglycan biosynthesis transport protein ExoP